MRHSSERVPGKNYRNFAGKPLYHYIIQTLLDVSAIDEVVIDTDSELILSQTEEEFPEVRLIERPGHLRNGSIPMNDVLLNSIRQVDADYYLQTHSTNPLLKATTIEAAINEFIAKRGMYDSLFSVTRLQTRLWDGLTLPVNHNPNILLRTQDLPPIYEENSCMYIFSRDVLEEHHNRIGKRPLIFEMDRHEAIDIDEEIDFLLAEQLYLIRKGPQ